MNDLLLEPRYTQLLLNLAKAYFSQPVRLVAYGSRAKGTAHAGSDLDLAVVACDENREIDSREFQQFRIAINESNIPILVQAFDYRRLPEAFRAAIDRDGIELVSA